ncbi:hypothetical protein IX317_002154 [Fusobacterium sp. DD29]|uniref:phage tail protein I n=1 Tax=unclassified Fusobacterium TaxID=2648384 RepID=UPI001B8D844F|nr:MULTISPECIES: phage tail protein I [unclassified Fusobacterium]MBR8701169.1 hypothetical protein [Fusobacterium sp. DD45]MBR8711318.1 hypothetical protein [Fusobacterium sp. DD28]MBR8750432.1 hypothetical protein [Fusobacterium sp. DD29]MBR8751867.1 hypothetical protein [Fusobacterium sp. DD26]MBR8762666.1 hypothetical protein [Fusobacterium sp. DD25]
MSKYKLEDTDYQIVFPQNLEKYKNLKYLAKEFEECLKNNVVSIIPNLAILKNLESQSDFILDTLAEQFSIDNWDEKFPKERKIQLIKAAYWAHSKKGTRKAVETEVNKLGYNVKLCEWWECGGDPYTFRVISNTGYIDTAWALKIVSALERIKNVRSVLEVINITIDADPKLQTIVGYKEIAVHKDIIEAPADKNLNSYINIIAYKQIIGGIKNEI